MKYQSVYLVKAKLGNCRYSAHFTSAKIALDVVEDLLNNSKYSEVKVTECGFAKCRLQDIETAFPNIWE